MSGFQSQIMENDAESMVAQALAQNSPNKHWYNNLNAQPFVWYY
jgi:hypothetical protein